MLEMEGGWFIIKTEYDPFFELSARTCLESIVRLFTGNVLLEINRFCLFHIFCYPKVYYVFKTTEEYLPWP